MTGECLTCGTPGYLEAHHVGGRHNWPTIIVPVCPECHRILTAWQLASGVELAANAPRTDLDVWRALLVGAAQLIQLYAQRHPERSTIGAPLAIHMARAVSKILDACGPPDRAGRWLPDPTVPPVEAVPVAWRPSSEPARVAELAHLIREVTELLTKRFGDHAPVPAEEWAVLAAHAGPLCAAVEAGQPELVEACAALAEHVARGDALIRQLLAVHDLGWFDEPPAHDLAEWIASGAQLLRDVVAVALHVIGVRT